MNNDFRISVGERSGIAVMDFANRLAEQPEVIAAELNMIFPGRSQYVPTDPNFSGSWGLHNTGQFGYTPDVDIDAPEAWDRNLGGCSILTVIIDTGVQQDHPDLHQLPGTDSTPSVNVITAISPDGVRSTFSCCGSEATFTGPGQDLFTTDRTGGAGFTSGDYAPLVWGTSFSSPMIAGIAALLPSEARSLDADEVEELLRESAVDLGAPGFDQLYGWGLPNAANALDALDLFSDSLESGDLSQWSDSTP